MCGKSKEAVEPQVTVNVTTTPKQVTVNEVTQVTVVMTGAIARELVNDVDFSKYGYEFYAAVRDALAPYEAN